MGQNCAQLLWRRWYDRSFLIEREREISNKIGQPFVDVVTTMLDDTIPLTAIEWEEWGNPQDKEYYDYIKSYSPYDNVKAKSYPHMLIRAGLNDNRVRMYSFPDSLWFHFLIHCLKNIGNLLSFAPNSVPIRQTIIFYFSR